MGARLMGSRMRSRARNGRDGAERRVTVQEGSQEAGSWLRAHQAGYEGFVGERRPDYQSSALRPDPRPGGQCIREPARPNRAATGISAAP